VCLAGFPDFTGATIATAAPPSIPAYLPPSRQSLQWAVSGSLLTYRSFPLPAGTSLFGVSSLAGGLAAKAAMLTGARLAPG
jgi:hypothetical protein